MWQGESCPHKSFIVRSLAIVRLCFIPTTNSSIFLYGSYREITNVLLNMPYPSTFLYILMLLYIEYYGRCTHAIVIA